MVLASSHLLIPVSDDFHFHFLAFLQGLSTRFHQNLAWHTKKIQINIRTMCVKLEGAVKLLMARGPNCADIQVNSLDF